MLIIPIVTGVLGGFMMLSTRNSAPNMELVDRQLMNMIFVWFINELFMIKHVFVLPGIWRKLFYPLFVALITVGTYMLVSYAVYVAIWITILIIAVAAIIACGVAAAKDNPQSQGRVIDRVNVSDGSMFGKELVKKDNDPIGVWRDSSGRKYEKDSDGNFSEKGF